jgi:Protein of unknown function (DUF2958)
MAKTADLEKSPYGAKIPAFNKPAYRYIRASDTLPLPTEVGDDPIARVKLFNPTGAGRWYLAAYDPATRIAYGAANIFEFELGDIDLSELVTYRGRFGLPIERDLHWTPRKLSECEGK